MKLKKDLEELVNAEIISAEIAENIKKYYENKNVSPSHKLVVIFGILGALLVGSGIILIIAHNWDTIPRNLKTLLAFIPLLIGQVACGYTLLKRPDSIAWRESSSAFLFFAVGACISLIGQIYQIDGELHSYLLTWMLLCLPLMYIMRSSIAALLYIIGITYYSFTAWDFLDLIDDKWQNWYWLLIIAALPFYLFNLRTHRDSAFTKAHNFFIPVSISLGLLPFTQGGSHYMFVTFFSLFGLFYLIGIHPLFSQDDSQSNSYKSLGSMGMVGILLFFSYPYSFEYLLGNSEVNWRSILSTIIITVIALLAFLSIYRKKSIRDIKPMAPLFILFMFLFYLGEQAPPLGTLFSNLILLILGILIVFDGIRRGHLGVLNWGLTIILGLAVLRFFDIGISFVIRGLLFLIVGVGFFLANYFLLKKRKQNEQ